MLKQNIKVSIILAATVLLVGANSSVFSETNTKILNGFNIRVSKDSIKTYDESLILNNSSKSVYDILEKSKYNTDNIDLIRTMPEEKHQVRSEKTVIHPYNKPSEVYNITFSKKLRDADQDFENKLKIAFSKIFDGDYETAENILDLLVLNEENLTGWNLAKAANLYETINNRNKAIFAYEKALNKLPERIEVLYSYSLCLYKAKYYDKAKYNLKRVISLNPEYMLAHYNLANIYFQNKDFINALKYFNNSIAINPLSADSYYNIGLTLETMNYGRLAVKYYSKCLKISPNDMQATQAISRLNNA